jgi:hypothetical protein
MTYNSRKTQEVGTVVPRNVVSHGCGLGLVIINYVQFHVQSIVRVQPIVQRSVSLYLIYK